MKRLLSNSLYMILYVSDLLSDFGDVLYYLALMSYVLSLPHPELGIALVSVSETLPILTSFLMGYLADRTPNKLRRIMGTLVFRVLLYLLMGLVMGMRPGLVVVIIAVIVNFLSDLSGQYENGLYVPISLRVVSDGDRELSFSFRQAVSSICSIGFQSAGAVLVAVMSYQALAFVNAGTFALSFAMMYLVKPRIELLLADRPIVPAKKSDASFIQGLWQDLKQAIRLSMTVPEVRSSLVIVPLLNGSFGVVTIMIPVLIAQDPQFVIVTPATTLALLSIILLIGGILGSVLGMTLLKNLSMLQLQQIATAAIPLVFSALYFHQVYLLFFLLLMVMIVAGCINPKFSALIMNRLPEEQLALISGGIRTYFQMGTVVMRLLASGLILVLPIDQLSLLCVVMGVGVVGYAAWSQWTSNQSGL